MYKRQHDDDVAAQQQEDMKRAARVNMRGLALLLESAIRAVPQPLLEQSIYKCLLSPSSAFSVLSRSQKLGLPCLDYL